MVDRRDEMAERLAAGCECPPSSEVTDICNMCNELQDDAEWALARIRELEAENERLKRQVTCLRTSGQLMANLAFNVTQRSEPLTLTERERELLKDAQVNWDAAVREPATDSEPSSEGG